MNVYFMQNELMSEKTVLGAELSGSSVASLLPSSDDLLGPSGLQSVTTTFISSQELM